MAARFDAASESSGVCGMARTSGRGLFQRDAIGDMAMADGRVSEAKILRD